jgi:two-component system, OmpR family, sensor histidine kinase KdpD
VDDERVPRPGGTEAAFALPIGFVGLLVIGAVVVSAPHALRAEDVLVLAALLVGGVALFSEPAAALPLAVIGWLAVAGFSRPPYAELHPAGTLRAAVVLGLVSAVSVALGTAARRSVHNWGETSAPPAWNWSTLEDVNAQGRHRGQRGKPDWRVSGLAAAVSRRRQLAGFALGAVALPLLTLGLVAARDHLALVDDLLLYLVVVVAVTLVGGFWPAVAAAVSASLLLNWFFSPPVHTWTIDAPENILALLLFVTVAVTVSSVVHVAARRAAVAAASNAEAVSLLDLARTVLGGDDTPAAVLNHLTAELGLPAELVERSGPGWARVASSGTVSDEPARVVNARPGLQLRLYGDPTGISSRVLDGFAAQAAAALDRERLRIQAAQAEALAEGNRMRTALLAAVSHDLRTPLASVKAAVSTLRQTDVSWSAQDRAELLATAEDGADRLAALIGNLLDMSRVHAGALQPFLRPTALDEVAPLAVGGIEGGGRVRLEIPEDLPLLATDPGLLERALANLVANALRYSPPGRPPTLTAAARSGTVQIAVIDHGPGVPAQERQRIFEPFQQLHDHRAGGEAGLGLAVAKGFVEAMGGRIEAAETPGGGLTMRVQLTAAAAERDAAGRAEATS